MCSFTPLLTLIGLDLIQLVTKPQKVFLLVNLKENLSLFDELYFISKLCALDDNERARETAEQCDRIFPTKRGYSSHNGVVTVISLDTQTCLDVEVFNLVNKPTFQGIRQESAMPKVGAKDSRSKVQCMEGIPQVQDQPRRKCWQHGDSWGC